MTRPGEPDRPMPLFGERALHLPSRDAVVVGDLHVGLEGEIRLAGLHLPSQTRRMRARIDALLERTRARRLLVIGDLKHRIPFTTRDEAADLHAFFEGIPCAVELVRGNHDVDLDALPPVVHVHEERGIRLGDVGLLHGHTWPSPEVMGASTVVTCHNHPAVLLVDALGHRHKEPCWIRAGFTPAARERYPGLPDDAELIVMPAFNDLVGGVAFNAEEGRKVLGPLFRNGLADLDGAKVFTLDGLDLGTVAGLRHFGDENPERPRRRRPERRKGFIE